jgi:hypothetical protein
MILQHVSANAYIFRDVGAVCYFIHIYTGVGGTLLVAQLVEALCYKPEGRGFGSR